MNGFADLCYIGVVPPFFVGNLNQAVIKTVKKVVYSIVKTSNSVETVPSTRSNRVHRERLKFQGESNTFHLKQELFGKNIPRPVSKSL